MTFCNPPIFKFTNQLFTVVESLLQTKMLFWILRSWGSNFQQDSAADSDNPQSGNRRRIGAYRWLYKNIFSTFRYGMVLLYVGTLLIVIGYHNPWIVFAR